MWLPERASDEEGGGGLLARPRLLGVLLLARFVVALWEVGARDGEGVEGDGGLVGLRGQVHLRGRVGEGQGEPAQNGGAPGGSSGLVVVAAGGQVAVEAAAQGVAMETPGGQLFKPQRVLALGSPLLRRRQGESRALETRPGVNVINHYPLLPPEERLGMMHVNQSVKYMDEKATDCACEVVGGKGCPRMKAGPTSSHEFITDYHTTSANVNIHHQ